MNIVLWIVQILLGGMFLMVGSMKTFNYEKAKESLPWIKDTSKGLVTFIGLSELLGGVGLILPYAIGVALQFNCGFFHTIFSISLRNPRRILNNHKAKIKRLHGELDYSS